MPRIRWDALPRALRDHLFERAAQREISVDDLLALQAWRRSAPIAPDGPWWKDFGSFLLCGEGALPKTFLVHGQVPWGEEIP